MKDSLARRGQGILLNPRAGLLALIILMAAVFAAIRPEFFSPRFVLLPLMMNISIFTVVGIAQMVVLSIGHMNLAVGQIASFGAMFSGIAFDLWHLPFYVGVAVGVLAGTAVGAISGWVIARTGVNSFVVTLAMSFALLGLVPTVYSWLVTNGSAFTSKPAGMEDLRRNTLADLCVGDICGSPAVPQMIFITAAVMILVSYMYSRTRLGRELLMTGSNISASELSGIPTGRRVIVAHLLSGTLAALAGVMLGVSTGSFTAAIGSEFMLPSFLGPILGGTLLAGGFVSVAGTFLGTALTSVIRTGLQMTGVGVESLNIFLGLILLLALSAHRLRHLLTALAGPRKRPRPPSSAPVRGDAPNEVGASR